MKYEEFLSARVVRAQPVGFKCGPIVAPLFPFQRRNVEWACRLGRCALFLDTGLGKTIQQLEWASQVCTHTGSRVLLLAPLAVGKQTAREAIKFGIGGVRYALDESDAAGARIVVTNYERLDKFDAGAYAGVVLDESSILKQYTGATKQALCDEFADTPYRLACTATPAPNDHTELGNHSEFLGVMRARDMLTRYFAKEPNGTDFRIKPHAAVEFWDWVSSWACLATLPSDLGAYSDTGYVLPSLTTRRHVVDVERELGAPGNGMLFDLSSMSATTIHRDRRRTADDRAARVAELVRDEPSEPWIVWCETDAEADALTAALEGVPLVREVRGSQAQDAKERALLGFETGEVRVLVTKPKIAGYGLNWQHCARVAFVGATFSFESYYQAIRRVWRFGQSREVKCHVVMANTDSPVWAVLERKRTEHERMKRAMVAAARRNASAEAKPGTYLPKAPMTLPEFLR
jgi:superfamily II DNA or RNA helicase